MSFDGFSEQTIDFLYGIFFQNERQWFEAHKEDYKTHLQQPMKALGNQVFDRLTALYPGRDLLCRVARIYRDARRCRGLDFYKESLWFTLQPPAEREEDYPCFWFELERENWSYGMGFWMTAPATMARHRARIQEDPYPLSRLQARLTSQTEFLLNGTSYARFKPGAPADLAGWYNMKNFSIGHNSPNVEETFDGPGLVERLVDGFSFLMPYYDYFYPLSQTGQRRPIP